MFSLIKTDCIFPIFDQIKFCFKGTVVNLTLSSLNVGSLEITRSVLFFDLVPTLATCILRRLSLISLRTWETSASGFPLAQVATALNKNRVNFKTSKRPPPTKFFKIYKVTWFLAILSLPHLLQMSPRFKSLDSSLNSLDPGLRLNLMNQLLGSVKIKPM